MRSYISYIIDGIWEAKQCILLGMILWLLWNLILFSLKKRSGEKLKKYGFKYLGTIASGIWGFERVDNGIKQKIFFQILM